MKFATIILSALAAVTAVQAGPSFIKKRGVPQSLVPDFGVRRGANPDGHGYVYTMILTANIHSPNV